MENENTNVLKTKGYPLEHKYGHGHQFLSTTLLTLNLSAFLARTSLELVDTPYRAIRQKLSARKTFFHDFTILTKYVFFESWSQLMVFRVEQLEMSLLILAKSKFRIAVFHHALLARVMQFTKMLANRGLDFTDGLG